MPPALKALASQLAGGLIAWLMGLAGLLPPGLWPLALAQAIGAVMVAALLRSARWWLPIHLLFVPLALAMRTLALAPGWYLAAFITLALIYWSSFRTQVPLYLSNRKTAAAVADLLPPDRPAQVLDIGSGTGSLLRVLARLRPDCHFAGIESAPGPWALGWIQGRTMANLAWHRGDFFQHSWQGKDVVYAFLSPVPMAAVWRKATAEMPPGSILISNSFQVPDCKPERVIEVDDRRRTRLFVYRIKVPKARN
ncbi:methyltransferase type 12 [Azoarcus sp. L1K30]|uniref:class I SAM-dependent methyltransferase n=1 Tax=Azoarcus sp. L1K30 TaxID=2820277 RepID=UPI001B83B2D7|nr:class I SAM-dependent methyltransferase [Azoarcus sp. L1K30]MBR0567923.1 methyltransferase type 12 [Azoarcus sp. L1K30]